MAPRIKANTISASGGRFELSMLAIYVLIEKMFIPLVRFCKLIKFEISSIFNKKP